MLRTEIDYQDRCHVASDALIEAQSSGRYCIVSGRHLIPGLALLARGFDICPDLPRAGSRLGGRPRDLLAAAGGHQLLETG